MASKRAFGVKKKATRAEKETAVKVFAPDEIRAKLLERCAAIQREILWASGNDKEKGDPEQISFGGLHSGDIPPEYQ